MSRSVSYQIRLSDDEIKKTDRCPIGNGHIPNAQLARDLLKPDSEKGYTSFSSAEALFADLNDESE